MESTSSKARTPPKYRQDTELVHVIRNLYQGKWILVTCLAITLIPAMLHTTLGTKWYRVNVVLAPSEEQSIPSLPGNLGGLAALAGVSIGGGGLDKEAIATLQSRDFVRAFLSDSDLVEKVSGSRSLPSRIVYGESESEAERLERAVDRFLRVVLRVTQDSKTNLVTVSVIWTNKHDATSWATSLVVRLNARMRDRALIAAEKNVDFLRSELSQTSLIEMQQSLGRLLEVELQKLMLAKGNEEFAFRVIDPAHEPRRHHSPNPSLTVPIALALGLLLGLSIVLALSVNRPSEDQPASD